jgi:hypothetical protein
MLTADPDRTLRNRDLFDAMTRWRRWRQLLLGSKEGPDRHSAPRHRSTEMADAVVLLAAPAVSLITRETVLIDGG